MGSMEEWTRWGLMGRSAAMRKVWEQVDRLGPSALDIHVFGETGTGKELVARALHAVSRRRGSLVPFHAAGVSDDLFGAELFGHTRGAFTGAHRARDGYVAAAESGTLFLDEVGDLSPRAQVRLLRFLQERTYHRLGETAPRRADVRIVSAANVDLHDLAREGRFREDLLFRLEGERIVVPPLRERGDDVVYLLRHFLRRELGSGRRVRLGPEVENALHRFTWPGNVRQLEREARRVAVRAADGQVEIHHLSAEVREAPPLAWGDLRRARADFDRRYVLEVLERHGWNRTVAAGHLGITRQALVGLIRRLGLAPLSPASG
jgi:two-component system response regulator HydG